MLWKLWVLSRLRRIKTTDDTVCASELETWKKYLTDRMQINLDNMISDKRNFNEKGEFCLSNSQANIFSDLTAGEMRSMITFLDNLKDLLRDEINDAPQGGKTEMVDYGLGEAR